MLDLALLSNLSTRPRATTTRASAGVDVTSPSSSACSAHAGRVRGAAGAAAVLHRRGQPARSWAQRPQSARPGRSRPAASGGCWARLPGLARDHGRLPACGIGEIYPWRGVLRWRSPPWSWSGRHGVAGRSLLVRGAWWRAWRILGLVIYMGHLRVGVPLLLISGVATGISTGVRGGSDVVRRDLGVVGFLSDTITCRSGGLVAVLYVDRRMRTEGLDLELQRATGVAPSPAYQAPPAYPAPPAGLPGPAAYQAAPAAQPRRTRRRRLRTSSRRPRPTPPPAPPVPPACASTAPPRDPPPA